jgi:hypothetical protein
LRKWAQWGAWLIDSWPPAATMAASPDVICCMPSATALRPEPHSWLTPQAGLSTGMPASIEAWRAGFWPCPAVRIWPRMTSSISPGSTPARLIASFSTVDPRYEAGTLDRAPLNEPTGVRTADTITTAPLLSAISYLLGRLSL